MTQSTGGEPARQRGAARQRSRRIILDDDGDLVYADESVEGPGAI